MTVWYPQARVILTVAFDGLGSGDTAPFIISGSQGQLVETDILPKSCSVHCNGYKEADTFECVFDAKRLPFTPEIVRAVGVEIYMFSTPGIVPPDQIAGYATPDNRLIAGLADNAKLHLSPDGREFSLDGRDYTALLIDKQWDPKRKIPHGYDLEDTVQMLVDWAVEVPQQPPQFCGGVLSQPSLSPGQIQISDADVQKTLNDIALKDALLKMQSSKPTSRLSVVFDADRDIPIVGKVGHGVQKASKGGAQRASTSGHGRGHVAPKANKVQTLQGTKQFANYASTKVKGKHGIAHKEGESYWDVIYQLCFSYGFIVYVEGWDIVISTPQNLMRQSAAKTRRMAYGFNLRELDVSRKLGKEKVPQIICRSASVDKRTKKPAEGRYPTTKDKVITGIGTKKDEAQVMLIDDVSDPAQLAQIAKTAYGTLARAEGTVRFKTKELSSLQAGTTPANTTPDLLQLRAGDPIIISWDPFGNEEMRKLSPSQRYDYLVQLGYSTNLASLVADEFDKLMRFDAPFYVREANFVWGHKEGISIDVEAIKYISVKRDSPDEYVSQTPQATTPASAAPYSRLTP